MQITCRLGEPFWRAVGAREVLLELPEGATVADALGALAARWPELGRLLRGQMPQDPEALGPMWRALQGAVPAQVFVNRRIVRRETWPDECLGGGDRLYLFLPTVGG